MPPHGEGLQTGKKMRKAGNPFHGEGPWRKIRRKKEEHRRSGVQWKDLRRRKERSTKPPTSRIEVGADTASEVEAGTMRTSRRPKRKRMRIVKECLG